MHLWLRAWSVPLIAALLVPVACGGTNDDATADPAGPDAGEGGPPGPLTFGNALPAPVSTWTDFPFSGNAHDIGGGTKDGSMWILGGAKDADGDYAVYYRKSGVWEKDEGAACVAIDRGVDETWCVDTARKIHQKTDIWRTISGSARDVGVGANEDVWIVGTKAVAGGYAVYRYAGDNRWTEMKGQGAVRIDVDPDGIAWIVNDDDKIFKFDGDDAWTAVAGSGIDVGIGADGTVFVVSPDTATGGNAIYRRKGTGWTKISKGGNKVSADTYGRALIVNSSGIIYQESLAAATTGVLEEVSLNGAGVSCNYTQPTPGIYDIDCASLLSVSGLKGIIRSSTDFSLGGKVGDLKNTFSSIGGLVTFIDSELVDGFNEATFRVDGPNQGNRLSLSATVGLGAAADGLDGAIKDMTGLSIKAIKPYVQARIKEGVVSIDALIYLGRAEKQFPEIGTSFALKSLRIKYDSIKGSKTMKLNAKTDIKVTEADSWVATDLTVTRTEADGLETVIAKGNANEWKKPFGYVPVVVEDATLTVGYQNRVMEGYRIDIKKATATTDGKDYVLAGSYAVDRLQKQFAFELETAEVPLLLAVQMLASSDADLIAMFKTLNLDKPTLRSRGTKKARIAFSPTGGKILDRTYDKESVAVGQIDFANDGTPAPASFDATAVVTFDTATKKYSVGDFSAKVSLDLDALREQIRSQSTVAADILSVFKLTRIGVDVKRVDDKVSGGGSASVRMCGTTKSLAFDTENIPKFITDGVAFVASMTQTCIDNATCRSGYERGGALCYPVCMAGYASDGATLCLGGCPADYRTDPLTCFRPAADYAVACFVTPNCQAGYRDSGLCTCIRDVSTLSRASYSRGAGVPLIYGD